jgi:hypothetical protein
VHSSYEANRNFAAELVYLMADNVWNEAVALHRSHEVQNAAPTHVVIPHVGRSSSGLLFEAVLEKYLQCLCTYFLLVLLQFRGYSRKLCPSNNPRRKAHKD